MVYDALRRETPGMIDQARRAAGPEPGRRSGRPPRQGLGVELLGFGWSGSATPSRGISGINVVLNTISGQVVVIVLHRLNVAKAAW